MKFLRHAMNTRNNLKILARSCKMCCTKSIKVTFTCWRKRADLIIRVAVSPQTIHIHHSLCQQKMDAPTPQISVNDSDFAGGCSPLSLFTLMPKDHPKDCLPQFQDPLPSQRSETWGHGGEWGELFKLSSVLITSAGSQTRKPGFRSQFRDLQQET